MLRKTSSSPERSPFAASARSELRNHEFGAQTESQSKAQILLPGADLLSDDPPSAIPDGAPAAVNKKADTHQGPSPEPTPPPPSEDALTVEEWTCLCVLDSRG